VLGLPFGHSPSPPSKRRRRAAVSAIHALNEVPDSAAAASIALAKSGGNDTIACHAEPRSDGSTAGGTTAQKVAAEAPGSV